MTMMQVDPKDKALIEDDGILDTGSERIEHSLDEGDSSAPVDKKQQVVLSDDDDHGSDDSSEDGTGSPADRQGRFQKRIDSLRRKIGDEEREKEAALEYARTLLEENRKLRTQSTSLSESAAVSNESEVDARIARVKRDLKEAFDTGDSDKVIEGQEQLAQLQVAKERARIRAAQAKHERENLEQGENQKDLPEALQGKRQSRPHPLAVAWARRNDAWYGKDDVASAAALAIDRRLQLDGWDPTSEEYYQELDKNLRRELPHKFASRDQGSDDSQGSDERQGDANKRNGNRPVIVASASNRRKTEDKRNNPQLSQEQKRLCLKLGISEEDYRAHMQLTENK